ncbi:hypothetical protein [Longispora urticae]
MASGEVHKVPVYKLRSLVLAGIAVLLTGLLLAGARQDHWVYAGVLLAVQALCVATWLKATRPAGWPFVGGVALLVGALADLGAVLWTSTSLAPVAYALASGFLLAVFGQLARRDGRARLTEAFAANLALNVLVVGFPVALVLIRQDSGARTLGVCLLAAGAAVAVARIVDIVPVGPRLAPDVPRPILGLLLGIAAGVGVAVAAAQLRTDLPVLHAVLMGVVTAGAAVLADLAVAYFEGDESGSEWTNWLASARGPVTAFAVAIPVAYVASVLIQGV